MPTDFVDPHTWMGETWGPDAPRLSMSFLHWMNSSEHLERTAVGYSDAGAGKTPALQAAARSLAVRYQPQETYYLCSGGVNGLHTAYRKGPPPEAQRRKEAQPRRKITRSKKNK